MDDSWNELSKRILRDASCSLPCFHEILLSSAQCVMARVKKINVVIYDDLAPWKLFSDKFSPYPNSSMRRSLVIFLLGTDHRHYHQYTDNGSLHRVWNNVLTFILKEHLLFSFFTASLSSSDSRNSFRPFMYLGINSCHSRTLVWRDRLSYFFLEPIIGIVISTQTTNTYTG